MAGNNSPWQGEKSGGGASVDADQEKPKFSGDDMEFESFMFDSGEGPSNAQASATAATAATAVAIASPPASATLDPVASNPASGPLTSDQAAVAQETIFAEAGASSEIPAFTFEASGPVDTAPVDPADMVLPAPPVVSQGAIAGEDVPLPFHLQSAEPEIPPFVPELPIKPLRSRQRSTGALPVISTGPLDKASQEVSGETSPAQAPEATAAGGWTDDSLSAVEDFSSVLLAMQAGTHFPLTTGGPAVLDSQPSGASEEAPAPGEVVAQSISPAPGADMPSLEVSTIEQEAPSDVQPEAEQMDAASPAVQMLGDGQVVHEDTGPADAPTMESVAPPADMQQEPAQLEASVPSVSSVPPVPTVPTVPVTGTAVAKVEENSEIEEGRFKGSDFEFESFMFTAPTTATPEAEPAAATWPVSSDTSPRIGGALPFWLQTGELTALPEQGPADVSPTQPAPPSFEAAMAEMKEQAADLKMESAPTLDSTQQDDYADLPPIDPFDFTLLGHVEEEESLGFNLQELEGMIPADRVSTKITTDLSALAEFLGTKPGVDTEQYHLAEAQPVQSYTAPEAAVEETSQEAAALMANEAQAEPETPEGEAKAKGKGTSVLDKGTTVLGKGTAGLRSKAEDDARPPSWTSTVTSGLSAETREQVEEQAAALQLQAEAERDAISGAEPLQEAGVVEPAGEAMPAVEELAGPPEIEIDPFSFTELDLDDEETATEQLSSMSTNAISSTSVLDSAGQPTTPVLRPQASADNFGSGIPLDTGSFDDENDTSFFSSAQPTKKVGAKSTGWLSDTEGQGSGEEVATESKAKTGSKARVARASTRERKLLDADGDTTQGKAKREDEIVAQEAAGSGGDHKPANYVSSGPLPTMEGFEALHEMADRNPDDLSTQMALAAAYAQSGEYDAALRTYRRTLKKRSMSPAMLDVIAEELSDIEAEASNLPRFHQVLGDLYMKQGRYQEAIDEYNKIG